MAKTTSTHALDVSIHGDAVGQLEFESHADRYGFAYTPDWKANRSAYYLAPAIPLERARARVRFPEEMGICATRSRKACSEKAS
jgi:hypothetical protein